MPSERRPAGIPADDRENLTRPVLKIAFVVATLIGLIFCISNIMFISTHKLSDKRKLAEHSLDARTSIQRALVAVLDAESLQRGYLLTGERGYLAAYESSRHELTDRIANLRHLTADNPRQQQRLLLMNSLISEKLKFLDMLVARRREGDSFDDIDLSVGHRLIVAIRNLFAIMDVEERQLYAERDLDLARDIRRIGSGLVALFGINVVFLCGLITALVKAWHRARQIERGEAGWNGS